MTVSKGMTLREAVALTVGLALTLTLTRAVAMLTMTMSTSSTLKEMELLTSIVPVLVLLVAEVMALLVVDHDANVACAPLSFSIGGCSLMAAFAAIAAVYPVAPAGLLVTIGAVAVLPITMRGVFVAIEMRLVSGTRRRKRARHVDGG